MGSVKPLVLDVDGTFLNTDILFECFWAGLGKQPLRVISTCLRNFTRPATLKRNLMEIAHLRTDLLPVHPEIKALADSSRVAGRQVILASASDHKLVDQLAKDHGLSDQVFASDGENNLKGANKAKALVAAFGEAGFDYAGNEPVDRAIWKHAENALIVGNFPSVEKELTASGKSVTTFGSGWRLSDLFRAMRPHQWVKNLLLLMPMVAAHDLALATLLPVLLGIVAFSAAASSIYIVNDLLDLEADRLHVKKRERPFARGSVPIRIGMIAFVVLGAIALGLGLALGPAFFAVVCVYVVLSLAYSLWLKRMRWVDIVTLATLYTLRVVAGAAAGQVIVSGFMLIFIFPIFITLGCVKRLTELTLAADDKPLPGRGYARPDRPALLKLSLAGTAGALAIFFAYSFSAQAQALYPTQWLLWVALIPIAAWLIRMVRLGYFGKQDHDPIMFALRDKRGIGLLMLTLSLMFYAAGLLQKWFGF